MGPNEIGTSSGQKKRWLWGCASVVTLCAVLAYAQWFFWGYVPVSTLPVTVYSEEIDKICTDTLFPLPYYSPDGKYYIDLDFSRHRDARVLMLFESGSHQLVGSYSYHDVTVDCWAQDSNAIYIADYISGPIGILDLEFLRPGTGIIASKKILVPCRSDLEGVSLLPRLYWEIRCALPGSEYSPFAVWFPLVVMTVGFVAGVRLLLWLWRRWVRPWWYGE